MSPIPGICRHPLYLEQTLHCCYEMISTWGVQRCSNCTFRDHLVIISPRLTGVNRDLEGENIYTLLVGQKDALRFLWCGSVQKWIWEDLAESNIHLPFYLAFLVLGMPQRSTDKIQKKYVSKVIHHITIKQRIKHKPMASDMTLDW